MMPFDQVAHISLDQTCTSPYAWQSTKVGERWVSLVEALDDLGLSRQAKKLLGCKEGRRAAFGFEASLRHCRCGLWYCPPCAHRDQKMKVKAWLPRIREVVSAGGGCGAITLTLPDRGMSALERAALLRLAIKRILVHRRWRGKAGWTTQLGIICAQEISGEEARRPNPHLHLVVFGPRKSVVGFLEWLSAYWLEIHPFANPWGQYWDVPPASNKACYRMLVYIFKRSRLNPAWPREYFEEAFEVFPPRTKHINSWGKLARKTPTPKPMKGTAPIELRVRGKITKSA